MHNIACTRWLVFPPLITLNFCNIVFILTIDHDRSITSTPVKIKNVFCEKGYICISSILSPRPRGVEKYNFKYGGKNMMKGKRKKVKREKKGEKKERVKKR